MSEFLDLAAYIQLFAAVNFAYIIPNFSKQIYDSVFDVSRMCTERNNEIKHNMSILRDLFDGIKDTDSNSTTASAVSTLKGKFEVACGEWKGFYDSTLLSQIADAKNKTNYGWLFLFVGLLCAWMLLISAAAKYIGCMGELGKCSIILLSLTALVSSFFSSKILQLKYNAYVVATIAFVIITIISAIIVAFAVSGCSCLQTILSSSAMQSILFGAVAIFPIYPIVFVVIQVAREKRRIGKMLDENSKKVEEQLNSILEKKKVLEEFNIVVSINSCN